LPDPPLPLVYSTEFEIGETFNVKPSVDKDDTYHESDNVFIKVHDFDATLAGRTYVNVVVTVPASPNNISPDPLDTF